MTSQMFSSFGEELTKIAFFRHLAQGFGGALRAGWGGTASQSRGMRALNTMGNIAGPALALPGAVSREDPSGQGRTRTERVLGLAGSTVGGMAASGAALNRLGSSAKGWKGFVLPTAAGVAGSVLGQTVATAPSALLRKRRQAAQAAQAAQQVQTPEAQQ